MGELRFEVLRVVATGFRLFFGRSAYYGCIALICAAPNLAAKWLEGGELARTMIAAVTAAALAAVTSYAVLMELRGQPMGVIATFRCGVRRFWPALGATTALFLLMEAALAPARMALAAPREQLEGVLSTLVVLASLAFGAMLFARYCLAAVAAVFEQLSPRRSLARSMAVMRGRGWTVASALLLQFLYLSWPLIILVVMTLPREAEALRAAAPNFEFLTLLYAAFAEQIAMISAVYAYVSLCAERGENAV